MKDDRWVTVMTGTLPALGPLHVNINLNWTLPDGCVDIWRIVRGHNNTWNFQAMAQDARTSPQHDYLWRRDPYESTRWGLFGGADPLRMSAEVVTSRERQNPERLWFGRLIEWDDATNRFFVNEVLHGNDADNCKRLVERRLGLPQCDDSLHWKFE